MHILDAAAPLEVSDIDWRSAPAAELDDAVVATLVYMRDVEGFTDRDLVGLTAHRNTVGDPVWTPVGVGDGYKPAAEFARVVTFLTSGAEGDRAVDRMDRRFAARPGLGDLRIYRGAADAALGA